MKIPHLLFIALIASAVTSFALEPVLAKKGSEKLSEEFTAPELGAGWRVQTGEWKVVDGVMRAKEIPADKHSAAARHVLPMQDGIYAMRFRLVENGTGFHFGFDPAKGELKKKGHLFSVIVAKAKVKLMKHVDKNQPEKDPNEELATAMHSFEVGTWYDLLVEKKGNDVAVQIAPEAGGATIELKASHPTFHVKTPTLVFRCIGDGAEVDSIKVWEVAE